MLRVRDLAWDRWILAGWCIAFAVMRAGRVQDTDPYWQVRAGEEWLTGTPLARPDAWSWAPVDGLFYPNSPLWNAALAVSWRAADSWGLFTLSALSMGAYFLIAVHLGRRLGASWVGLTFAVIATALAALPMLSPRAGVPAQALVLAGIAAAYAWSLRAHRHTPLASAIVAGSAGLALSTLGNWIHLSWSTMAFAVAAAWSLIWILTPALGAARRASLLTFGTVGLLAGIGLGPYGWQALDRAQAVYEACHGLITEWVGVLHPEAIAQWAAPGIAATVLALLGAAWAARQWRRDRFSDTRIRLVVALLIVALPASLAGFTAVRFTGVALLTLLPITALLVTQAGHALHRRAVRRSGPGSRAADYSSSRLWTVVLGFVLMIVSPFVVLYAAPHGRPLSAEVISRLPAGCRLFSQGPEAAAVILLRPDVPVWFDGRADYWGRGRIIDFYGYLQEVRPDAPVPEGTTCVLLPSPARVAPVAALVAALDASPHWQRTAEDGQVILWVPR